MLFVCAFVIGKRKCWTHKGIIEHKNCFNRTRNTALTIRESFSLCRWFIEIMGKKQWRISRTTNDDDDEAKWMWPFVFECTCTFTLYPVSVARLHRKREKRKRMRIGIGCQVGWKAIWKRKKREAFLLLTRKASEFVFEFEFVVWVF